MKNLETVVMIWKFPVAPQNVILKPPYLRINFTNIQVLFIILWVLLPMHHQWNLELIQGQNVKKMMVQPIWMDLMFWELRLSKNYIQTNNSDPYVVQAYI